MSDSTLTILIQDIMASDADNPKDLSQGMIPPPPGVVPNFINPTHRTGTAIACNVVCLTLALVFVGLRLWTKTFIIRSVGWDDSQNYGIGVDEWNITVYQTNYYFRDFAITRWFFFQYLFFVIAIGLVKMSILFLYLRLMPTSQRKSRICTHALLAVVVGAIIALDLSYIFACKPFAYRWNGAGGNKAKCFDVTLHSVLNEAINMIVDLLIIGLPIPMVWALHLSTKKKIGVILVFATGLLVVAVAAVRLAITVRMMTYEENVSFFLWHTIQLYVALICCCLPSLKAFFKGYLPSIHGPNTTLFGSRLSSPDSKLSNKPSKARSHLNTIDEIMLENGTRSLGETYLELKEASERDDTYVMGSEAGLHDRSASSERIVEPGQGKAVTSTVSVTGDGRRRDGIMEDGQL
ncbi:MAG: hypothetical protein M1836_000721 [Candelina mexicana]|nr:MAG: hypothetical protein M1836_000721 [Candelina mexicana]